MTNRSRTLELASDLRLAVGRMARRLRQHSHDGLTPSQRSALATLERQGPLRVGELAVIENVTAPSISGIVSRLEEKGMVTRSPNPRDARSTVVMPTRRALTVLDNTRSERTAFLAARLDALDSSDRELLAAAAALLERMATEE